MDDLYFLGYAMTKSGESRSLIPFRMNEGGDEKQECDRQMSGSGWPLSVAFLFWANRSRMRAGSGADT